LDFLLSYVARELFRFMNQVDKPLGNKVENVNKEAISCERWNGNVHAEG